MSKSESKRRVGSYLRRKKKIIQDSKYECQVCHFSLLKDIEEFDQKPKPEEQEQLKIYHEARSVLLSKIQVHHIVPLSDGGTNQRSNIMVVCENCHKDIHKILDEEKNKKRAKIKEKKGAKIKVIAQSNKKIKEKHNGNLCKR